ncbi:hypothetical protein [Cohnella candidum]|uniref:Uncharacterized protein n=1 Tax=Cohnella candidum TaxID=2674991 RepID=A0A3G3JUD0_9BACL|nr:hypothetical protein [Cohnella candidum]AYQ71836.1 hypothetical protein EAV92_04190 [Cohnella candidum]
MDFLFISIVEYVGILCGLLSLFRFQLRYYIPQIIFASVACSFLSHALSLKYQVSYAPIVQLVVLILFLWLLFQIAFFYSALMALSYTVAYVTIQGGVIWVINGFFPEGKDFSITGTTTYEVQITFAVINFLLAWYLQKRYIGYTFVPTSMRSHLKWNRINRYLALMVVATFVTLAATYMLYTYTHFQWFILAIVPLILSTFAIFHLLKRRERLHD